MNEKAIQQVISDYAMEAANLRLAVATLREEKDVLNNELIELKKDKKEEEK